MLVRRRCDAERSDRLVSDYSCYCVFEERSAVLWPPGRRRGCCREEQGQVRLAPPLDLVAGKMVWRLDGRKMRHACLSGRGKTPEISCEPAGQKQSDRLVFAADPRWRPATHLLLALRLEVSRATVHPLRQVTEDTRRIVSQLSDLEALLVIGLLRRLLSVPFSMRNERPTFSHDMCCFSF